MEKRIYVGNLPFSATEAEVREMFAQHGTVLTLELVANDRDASRCRGFGFVEMDTEEADVAIEALDGVELGGRPLRVSRARKRREEPTRRSW